MYIQQKNQKKLPKGKGLRKPPPTKQKKKNRPIVNNHYKAIITKEFRAICAPPRGYMLNKSPKRIKRKIHPTVSFFLKAPQEKTGSTSPKDFPSTAKINTVPFKQSIVNLLGKISGHTKDIKQTDATFSSEITMQK